MDGASAATESVGTQCEPRKPSKLVLQTAKQQKAAAKKQKVAAKKQLKREQEQAVKRLTSQDLSSILVQLESRSIRIGSYRGHPADRFKITIRGVQITITSGENCLLSVLIHIGSNEITKVMCHLGESMPCMFLDTTPSCAQRLRQALEMVPGNEPYYDPQSQDEVHKRIIILFNNLGELGIENYIRAMFSEMKSGHPYFNKEGNLLEEIELQEAKRILTASTPPAQLQLLHLSLDADYHGDEDKAIDRSRSPSPARVVTGQIDKTKFMSDDSMAARNFMEQDSDVDKEVWWYNLKTSALNLNVPLTVQPYVTVQETLSILTKQGYDQVPVVRDGGEILGVVTTGHIMSQLTRGKAKPSDPVEKIFFKQFKTVTLETKLGQLSRVLDTDHFVLVVQDQRQFQGQGKETTKQMIFGIATRIDLLNFIASSGLAYKPVPVVSSEK